MPKDKPRKGDRKKKAGKKASQFAIRVEKAERDAFVALCERLDTSAAREVRRFMRDFVERHHAAQQPETKAETPEPEAVADAVETPVADAPEATPAKPARTRRPRASVKSDADAAPTRRPRKPAGGDNAALAPRRGRPAKSADEPAAPKPTPRPRRPRPAT